MKSSFLPSAERKRRHNPHDNQERQNFQQQRDFMGPLDATKPWQTKGIEGMNRFLGRAWRSIVGDDDAAPVYVDEAAPEEIQKIMHQSIIKVSSDIEAMSFNTAISQLMIFNNEMMKMDKRYREPCETLQKLFRLGNESASDPAALALQSFRKAPAALCAPHRRRNVEHSRSRRFLDKCCMA